MKKNVLALSVALVGSAVVAGCGGSSGGSEAGGMDVSGQFIVDTGYVAGTSSYTGLTSANGVVYASRIDATSQVITGGSEDGSPIYNSVILRAAPGADEFTVVQRLQGQKVGGIDAISVTSSVINSNESSVDELVVACISGNKFTTGTVGVDETYDDVNSTEVELRFYRDEDLADTTLLTSEEKTATGFEFNNSEGQLNTCVDVSVASTGSAPNESTLFAIGVAGEGFEFGGNYPNRAASWLVTEARYDWQTDEVSQDAASGDFEPYYSSQALTVDFTSTRNIVDSVELAIFEGNVVDLLTAVRHPGQSDVKLDLTFVGGDALLVNQDDNVFSGNDPEAMALSSLQQFPGSSRFFAVHEMFQGDFNGLAVFDVNDAVAGSGDGARGTPTRFENVGQTGLFCRGELTFVTQIDGDSISQVGLCMDGTDPGTFRFFDVPVVEEVENDQDAGDVLIQPPQQAV